MEDAIAAIRWALGVGGLSLALGSTPLVAQTPDTTTIHDHLVVSAQGVEQPADEVGSSVTVIERAEIERSGARTLGELLRSVPGVSVRRSGPWGGVTSIAIRGGNGSHTAVLLDGLRLNEATTGGLDLADLPVAGLERVEILRGPQSSLYGSEALAGVVSITTRAIEEGEGRVDFGAGNLGLWNAGAAFGDRRGRVGYRVEIGHDEADGVSAAPERLGNREDDAWQRSFAQARLTLDVDAGGGWLTVHGLDSEVDFDTFDFLAGGYVDDLDAVQSRQALRVASGWRQRLGDRWTLGLRAGWTREDLDSEDPTTSFNNYSIRNQRWEVEVSAEADLGSGGSLIVGLDSEESTGVNEDSFDEGQGLNGLFARHLLTRGAWTVSTALRWDDHETAGDELTGRLAFSWRLPRGWRAHASWGTGFRAPALNELYFPFFGNSDLAPERSRGWDLGAAWTGAKWSLDMTAFAIDSEDLIGVSPTFTAINIAQARQEGLELSARVGLTDRWRLEAAWTRMDSEDRGTGGPLAFRPENEGSIGIVRSSPEGWTFDLRWLVVRDRVDNAGRPADDWDRVDLALGWPFGEHLELRLTGQNLLDEDYEEIPGFTSPGISGRLGCRLRF